MKNHIYRAVVEGLGDFILFLLRFFFVVFAVHLGMPVFLIVFTVLVEMIMSAWHPPENDGISEAD